MEIRPPDLLLRITQESNLGAQDPLAPGRDLMDLRHELSTPIPDGLHPAMARIIRTLAVIIIKEED
jgi:hypothetical protein